MSPDRRARALRLHERAEGNEGRDLIMLGWDALDLLRELAAEPEQNPPHVLFKEYHTHFDMVPLYAASVAPPVRVPACGEGEGRGAR